MAVYKVIQDVEAEDKILGPLSLKQLIFAAIAFGTIFIAFRLVVATGVIYLAIPFLPIILVFGFLAAPIGRDQPTEMWLAAQIRYFTKPRVRKWDQSDIKNLVNITVPKREEKIYTDGLDQQQVHSRLKALASTLDSRGWAVKNVDVNMYATNVYGQAQSDRLVDPSSLPTAVSDIDIKASDDIMDVTNNETAHHFDEMMQATGKAHKEALLARMQQPNNPTKPEDAPQDYWFMHQQAPQDLPPDQAMFDQNIVQPVTNQEKESFLEDAEPGLSAEEQEIIERAKREKETTQSQYSSHHKVILTPEQQRIIDQKKAQEEKDKNEQEALRISEEKKKEAQQQKTQLSNTDKMNLVESGFKLDTISSLAKHKIEEKKDDGEVVIKLR